MYEYNRVCFICSVGYKHKAKVTEMGDHFPNAAGVRNRKLYTYVCAEWGCVQWCYSPLCRHRPGDGRWNDLCLQTSLCRRRTGHVSNSNELRPLSWTMYSQTLLHSCWLPPTQMQMHLQQKITFIYIINKMDMAHSCFIYINNIAKLLTSI